jgi:hypothetical protein
MHLDSSQTAVILDRLCSLPKTFRLGARERCQQGHYEVLDNTFSGR